ncbi:MAG: YceI family protein, partial [Bacteroidota bacterium]
LQWFLDLFQIQTIEAHNYQVGTVMDAENGNLAFQALMRSFHFKKALMLEHFNEKYLESDKFPKATFKGQIKDFADLDISKEGTYDVEVTGDLTIHGVTKAVSTPGKLIVTDKGVQATAKFTIELEAYEVDVPALYRANIAENIDIEVDVMYTK